MASADYRVDILNGSAGLITPANPLPVTVTGAIALGEVEVKNDAGNPVPVSGTVTVSNPGSGGLTDAELRASPVDVALPGLPGLEINQVSVGTSEVPVPAVPLTGRATISVKALAANGAEVYVRRVTVSTTTGWELSAGDSIDIDCDDTTIVMAISASGTQRVCYAEI